jgi:uncharacterized membrane protein
MQDTISRDEEEKSIKKTQTVVVGFGLVLVLIGIVRQWPIYGKTYMQFIEGEGYLALMVGLITVILGLSIRLFTGDYYEDQHPGQKDAKNKEQ